MSDYVEPLYTTVTTINGRYHCRLMVVADGFILQEQACHDQRDIGFAMREMMRWHDKMSMNPFSKMADASRHRGKNFKQHGKIDIIKNIGSSL